VPSLGLPASLRASSGRVGSGGFATRQVRYLGRENSNGPNYSVQNWSTPVVPKTINIATNRYGKDGFYQIRPGAGTINEAAGNGNDLGISAATQPTIFSHPSFATVFGYGGTFVSYPGFVGSPGSPVSPGAPGSSGYPSFLQGNATVLTPISQGALSIPINEGPYDSPSGANASKVGAAFSVIMTQTATFLLGIAVGAVNDKQYAPDFVSVFNSNTGSVFSARIPRGPDDETIPRLPVFLITGITGDQFIIGLWQDTAVSSVAPVSLITFDRAV